MKLHKNESTIYLLITFNVNLKKNQFHSNFMIKKDCRVVIDFK